MNERTIKLRQRWVLGHPCRVLDECGRPGYRADFVLAGHPVATVLTIDLFAAPLAWHADVARIDEHGKTLPLIAWSETDRTAAFDLARRMLDGVGSPDGDGADCDQWKVGIVRPLTDREIACVLGNRRPIPAAPAIGEVSIFDFSDAGTEAGPGIHVPQTRRIVYARGN